MRSLRQTRPYRTLTTLRTVVAGLVILLAGIALLYIGGLDKEYWKNHQGPQALVNNLGALLVISVALGAVWELVGKRAFARELLETAKIAAELDAAGLIGIVADYLAEVDWEELFHGTRSLDIFAAYGRTWRIYNLQRLQRFAASNSNCIRIYLPDIDDKALIKVLADRFAMNADELSRRIAETRTDFEALRTPGGGAVEVYYCRGDRFFSFYLFDSTAIITLYKHKSGRGVPTFICRERGSLYNFIQSELTAIKDKSRPV